MRPDADVSPMIIITPEPALSDQMVHMQLVGCAPGQRVTLRAKMDDDAGQRWRSWADCVANATGVMDLATAAPLAVCSISSRDVGLPTSSSDVKSTRSVRFGRRPRVRSA